MGRLLTAAIALAVGCAAGIPARVAAQVSLSDTTGTLPHGNMPVIAPLSKPTLKRSAVVVSDIVRIGDLIDNAGAFANIAVFRSPDVGTTGSVSARRVIEAAHAHNLMDIDADDVVEVEVTRTGHAVTKHDLEARIIRVFAGTNGLSDGDDLVLRFDREVPKFYADVTDASELKAVRAFYEPHGGRFDVLFEVPTGPSRHMFMRYTGTLVETMPVVVPTRSIGRGETVRTADLAIERRPKAEIVGDIVVTISDAIGHAARQSLRQSQPLRRADLMQPEMVKRDDNVTLTYEVPGITLTTRGKALDSGSEGDLINVVNVQSKRTLQGIVTGPGRVNIGAAARSIAATPQANGVNASE